MDEPSGFLVPAGAGRKTRVPVPNTSFKAVGVDTGGCFTLLEYVMSADIRVHKHDREHECAYVLAGRMKVRVGLEDFTAGVGDFVFMPRGVPHSITAVSEVPPRFLVAALVLSGDGGWSVAASTVSVRVQGPARLEGVWPDAALNPGSAAGLDR